MNIDRLSPATVGEDKIKLTLDAATFPKVGFVCEVLIDYSKCQLEGVSLPIEAVVQGPTSASYISKTYRTKRPDPVLFFPSEVGEHLVVVREIAHNRWVGTLRITVAGDIGG